MRKNCSDALNRFLLGEKSPRSAVGSSIWTDGTTIWSYATALVIRDAATQRCVLNRTTYSRTTTVHQNALAAFLGCSINKHVEVLAGIPRGFGSEALLRDVGRVFLALV
jgi:hypothetical protein